MKAETARRHVGDERSLSVMALTGDIVRPKESAGRTGGAAPDPQLKVRAVEVIIARALPAPSPEERTRVESARDARRPDAGRSF